MKKHTAIVPINNAKKPYNNYYINKEVYFKFPNAKIVDK